MVCQDVVIGQFNPTPVRAWANTLRRVCTVLGEEMKFVEAGWRKIGREEEFEVYGPPY